MAKKLKISYKEAKETEPIILLRLIKKMKKKIKEDPTAIKLFKDHDVDIDELDLIPMTFKRLDVSAKCDHAVIYFNYKLLCEEDFDMMCGYMLHEVSHWVEQTSGSKPTQSSDDGEYLDNKSEQRAFTNQVSFIADNKGEDHAEEYVDDLLEHHEIDNKKEKEEKKDILMDKV